jgi:hypothetical protein
VITEFAYGRKAQGGKLIAFFPKILAARPQNSASLAASFHFSTKQLPHRSSRPPSAITVPFSVTVYDPKIEMLVFYVCYMLL